MTGRFPDEAGEKKRRPMFRRLKRVASGYFSYWKTLLLTLPLGDVLPAWRFIREGAQELMGAVRRVNVGAFGKTLTTFRESDRWTAPRTYGWRQSRWDRVLARQRHLTLVWAGMAAAAVAIAVWAAAHSWPAGNVAGFGILALALALRALAHWRVRQWLHAEWQKRREYIS